MPKDSYYKCPTCNKKLADSYQAGKNITEQDHGDPYYKCKSINRVRGEVQHKETKSKKYLQDQGRVQGTAAGKERKVTVSVNNLNSYQSQAKDRNLQAQREATATQQRVPGHGSGTSASNRNNGTTGALNRINNTTPK